MITIWVRDLNVCRLRCTRKLRVSDWVLCCHFVELSTQLAVLSAHNVLSFWDSRTGDCLFQAACAEQCLLYPLLLQPFFILFLLIRQALITVNMK